MKTKPSPKSGFITTRNLLGVLLCTVGLSLAVGVFAAGKQATKAKTRAVSVTSKGTAAPNAPTPTSGTLTSTNTGSANALNWADSVGSVPNFTFFAGNGTCQVPQSCSTFTLTIDPSVGTASAGYDPTKYVIFIELSWPQSAEDYDTWICSGAGNCVQANVVGSNASTADPEVITLPTNTAPGAYTINAVMTQGGPTAYNGTVYLRPVPQVQACTGNCTPPRYFNYPAGPGQGDGAGEPSLGVDWNPNVATLKDITSPDFATGTKRLNTGGVAFMTMNGVFPGTTQNGPGGEANWRVNFDDCPSPAINKWEDVSAIFAQTTTTLVDPIGFTDHYTSAPLGLTYPEPLTTGRVFQLQLNGGQGNSAGAYSDNDGNSYLPGANGGPIAGPDHETLGGGPYSTGGPGGVVPPHPLYANAIYYCSQNIAGEAQCSRSDNGGQTFGPGIPIYNPMVCVGGIHGHVKVAPDGTVYVPNSSCGANGATTGVAMSLDNGLTWTDNTVPGSFSSQDPSVGIGENGVGKPAGNLNGTNTIYIGYIDGDGHAKVAYSGNRGATWSSPVDVGIGFGVKHGVFPVVVAGDDNRAAFGFLGTGDGISTDGNTCDPYGATLNCGNIWHLYVATTYDGGANWITVDATPNDPVQVGTVCLQGTLCAGGRNLLDFNDFTIDAEGRGMVGYADGCVNCNNGQTSQSNDAHATVARQSGGRRLFSHFDPIEPMPPASPQLVSAVSQSGGTHVTWLEPDNGGSPITGYNVYRSGTSGTETFLAHISGETTTTYLDPAPLSGGNFYYAQAINAIGEGDHCGELTTVTGGTACLAPYLQKGGPGIAGNVSTDPTQGELTIQSIHIGEPFSSCNDNSITFTMKVQTLDPGNTGQAVLPENAEWKFSFVVTTPDNADHEIFVEMDTFAANNASSANPNFSYGQKDPVPGTQANPNGSTQEQSECFEQSVNGTEVFNCPNLSNNGTGPSASFTKDGTITIKLNFSVPLSFTAAAAPAVGAAFTWDGSAVGTTVKNLRGITVLEAGVLLETVNTTGIFPEMLPGGHCPTCPSYPRAGNLSCHQLPPIAVLSGSPLSGNAPLTVNFNGTGSHKQAGACGTINSYTLNFGDGSAAVTNATGTFSHSYTAAGDYAARLTVSDTLGLTSITPAQVTVSVTNPIQLVSVVSRMTHGTITPPFEVNLPLTGTRGVECRNGLGAGNYAMVFQFDNAVTSVGSASVATGTGSVSSSSIGLNNHEYIVNLTGVTNAQYISVNLANVNGSLNVVGPQMGVLVGDTNADGFVNSADIGQTKSQSGQAVTGSNFREDLNADGFHNSADIGLTKSKSGTALPSTP